MHGNFEHYVAVSLQNAVVTPVKVHSILETTPCSEQEVPDAANP